MMTSPARTRLRSICGLSTRRSATRSAACEGGAERETEQLADGRPFGVPGAVGTLVDRERGVEVQLRGEVRGAERRRLDEDAVDGVALVRHRAGLRLPALMELADLGAREVSRCRPPSAERVDDGDEPVAEARDRRATDLPRDVRCGEAGLVRELADDLERGVRPNSSTSAARFPAEPPSCAGGMLQES